VHEPDDVIAGARPPGGGHVLDVDGSKWQRPSQKSGVAVLAVLALSVRSRLTPTKEPAIAMSRHMIGAQQVGCWRVAGRHVDATGAADMDRIGVGSEGFSVGFGGL
jgi:hypothetical protein